MVIVYLRHNYAAVSNKKRKLVKWSSRYE